MEFDHLLVIGFGAPEKQADIPEFLRIVTRGTPVPESRLQEVAQHYKAIGGGSPYNRYTLRLVEAIKQKLRLRAAALPFFVGMRNWHPFLKDTVREIKAGGFKKGLGIILAPHRSDASWDKYIRAVEEAKRETGADIEYEYLAPWHYHPGFIGAQADFVRKAAADRLSPEANAFGGDDLHLLFTAHSIPVEMAERSKYAEEFNTTSRLVAHALNHPRWSVAYQSRSGRPDQPWLEPDVNSVILKLAAEGAKTVLLVPVGFLCDNAEVLYDLDLEAKAVAEKAGIRYLRASTVMDHPEFSGMLAALIREHLQ